MMANVPDEVRRLILTVQNKYDVSTFVETGTNLGETAEWASRHFNHVYTIEASEQIHSEAMEKRGHIDNLELIQGSSTSKLSKLVAQIDQQAVVYLDAHLGTKWQSTKGPNSDKQPELTECPLLDELDALSQSGYKHFIFIDDARVFTSPRREPFIMEEWPHLQEIITSIESIDPGYDVMVYGDHIIAAPPEEAESTRLAVREIKTRIANERPNRSPVQTVLYRTWDSAIQPIAQRVYRSL